MKKLLSISILFLTACSFGLPDKSREISDFVPQEKIVVQNPAKFDWVAENYPAECRWEKLLSIIDGDTIKTAKSGKIRLIGINTPEVKSPYTEEQPGGKEATIKIRGILANSEKVCLIHDEIGDQTDKYGRSLDYVFTEDGTDINAEMVRTGFARWYSRFPYERKLEFKEYQNSAKKAGIGLWE
jgi:micrococcal nuclease